MELTQIIQYIVVFNNEMFSSILDMQLKLDQEKVARQCAENRLLEVEKYKSELSVDIKQYEQQIANLQNEYKSEKDKVKKISSHRTTYISGYCYVNSFVHIYYRWFLLRECNFQRDITSKVKTEMWWDHLKSSVSTMYVYRGFGNLTSVMSL